MQDYSRKQGYLEMRETKSACGKTNAWIVRTKAIDQSNTDRTLLPTLEPGDHVRQEDRNGGPDTSAAKRDESVSICRGDELEVFCPFRTTYRTAAFFTVAQMINENADRVQAATICHAF
jgi:hypothetical protein